VQEVVSQFPSLQSGERYLLFLTPSPFPGEFYPVGAFQGVFTVSADGLVNNVSQAASATGVSVHDVPLDQVQESIRTAPALDASP
jgi:hypothetical protein